MTRQLPGGDMRGDRAPRTYTTGQWPHYAEPDASAPPGVHYSLALARALHDATVQKNLSHRAASELAGLNATAVGRIVRGEVYPDLATLARLEVALRAPLLDRDLHRSVSAPAPAGTTERPE
ncbi:helix-turn-helix domain-containing protein [Streptomyces eurythermus]|uniref:helix-turn-helix domain-containing protein n=1 Tax=Streptomyces eurythermus TaxID=42237 RepID=UPI00368A5E8B